MKNEKFTTHVIPQFHYDIEYILTLGEYQEIAFNNLVEAHAILSKNSRYTFMVEQTFLMESFMAEHPSRAADFAEWAKEGRFEMASGMYAMACANIPSGESLIRQLAYGRKWCERNLGGYAPTCMNNGDCPGGHPQMPQISRICGFEYYVFERAVDDCERESEFIWRGLDGSEVKTCWLPLGYGGWRPSHGAADDVAILADAVDALRKHAISNTLLLSTGGDFRYPDAGGPAALERFNNLSCDVEARYSTYAAGMAAVDWSLASTYEGEFNPDRQGYLSGRIRLKQLNRSLEQLLFTTEALSETAERLLSIPYDFERLDRAWKLAFLNQFHDTIWGTITDRSYEDALIRHSRAEMLCDEMINRRASAILAAIPERKPNESLIYNPLPWERRCWVDPFENEVGDYNSGLRVDFPKASASTGRWLDLPTNGYRLCDFADPAEDDDRRISAGFDNDGELTIETPFLRCVFSADGAMRELRGADGALFTNPGKPFFNTICYQTDHGDLMYCYESPLLDTLGEGLRADVYPDPCPDKLGLPSRSGNKRIGKVLFSHRASNYPPKLEIESVDSKRVVVSVSGRFGHTGYHPKYFDSGGLHIEFKQRIIFYADSPRIDCSLRTEHLKGRRYRLRAVFPLGLEDDAAIIHQVPFGEFQRPEGEFPAQNYIRCDDGTKGVAIINKGLPGNNVTDDVITLSLMRSAYQEYLDPCDKALEEGETHFFEYAILPYETKAAPDFARIAAEFNTSPIVCRGVEAPSPDITETELSTRVAGFAVSAPEICCSAIHADGDFTVVRLWNSAARPVDSELTVPFHARVAETDALLAECGATAETAAGDGGVSLSFRAFEIKTLRVERLG